MTKKIIRVKFIGIDSWHRPIFKSITSKDYYGSVWNLFGYEEEEIQKCLDYYNEEEHLKELVYFGSSFNCEPLGLPLERIRLELA